MMGSQASLGGDRGGPELPGMENLGADAVMMGGIELSSEIPAGMEFIPSSVPDGEYDFNVAATGQGEYLFYFCVIVFFSFYFIETDAPCNRTLILLKATF